MRTRGKCPGALHFGEACIKASAFPDTLPPAGPRSSPPSMTTRVDVSARFDGMAETAAEGRRGDAKVWLSPARPAATGRLPTVFP